MPITLSQAKTHLRLNQNLEDDLVQLYIDAAKVHIGQFLNRSSYPSSAPIKAAALLIVADLYENREGQTEKELKLNPAVCSLLYPFREDIGI